MWHNFRPEVEKNSFLQFFDVIFGNSQQAKLDGIAGQAVTVFALLHQVSIEVPSQQFGWKDFLWYGRGIMKEAPKAAIDAMQRHSDSLPRLQDDPDLQQNLLHCISLRHALSIAWSFADRPENFVSKMGAHICIRRGCEDLEAGDDCQIIQNVLIDGERLSQEGLFQWLHVAFTRYLSRDLVQLLDLLVPVLHSDKIAQALHTIRQKTQQPLYVDMSRACTFIQSHPDHWLSSWLLSNMCCYVGHSRFASITNFNWDSLVSAAGAVLAARNEDLRGEPGRSRSYACCLRIVVAASDSPASVCRPPMGGADFEVLSGLQPSSKLPGSALAVAPQAVVCGQQGRFFKHCRFHVWCFRWGRSRSMFCVRML